MSSKYFLNQNKIILKINYEISSENVKPPIQSLKYSEHRGFGFVC